MQHLYLVGGGILIGLIVAAPIGPVNLICLRRTLAYGPLNGFFSGLGAALGDGFFAAISGFGLTVVGQLIEGYSIPLTLVGGLMLLGFGVHTFQSDVSVLRNQDGAPARSDGSSSIIRAVASTFALTVTNPATLFGFTALFAGLGSLAGQEVLLEDAAAVVSGVVAGSILWWFTLAVTVGIFHRHVGPAAMRKINHFFGLAVGGFGVVVLGGLVWRLL
jgi:threonine/homoserine/homoserine lactone efflux protein